MSCNKLSTYEVMVVVEEKFNSVQDAVDNKDAIGEPVVKVVNKRFLKSNIKLEDKHGLRSKEGKGSAGKPGESSKGDAKS